MSISRRRLFLASASGVAGAAALAGAQAGRSPVRKAGISPPKNRLSPLDGVARENIKITGIKVMNLGYRLTPEEEWPDADNNVIIWKTESVIAVVSTDAGITGIGGCSRYNGPEEMRQYVETVIKPIILGKNPFDVEYLAGGISGPRARGVWAGIECAGINRHVVGDERALQERRSDSILTSSLAPVAARRQVKRRQRHRWAGRLSSEN